MKLNKKIAKALLKQELGISVKEKDIKKEQLENGSYSYYLETGKLTIFLEQDLIYASAQTCIKNVVIDMHIMYGDKELWKYFSFPAPDGIFQDMSKSFGGF